MRGHVANNMEYDGNFSLRRVAFEISPALMRYRAQAHAGSPNFEPHVFGSQARNLTVKTPVMDIRHHIPVPERDGDH
jgi:hypothetical protein